MRIISSYLVWLIVTATAVAEPLDLDTADGPARLADSAGACAKTAPAFIRAGCRDAAAPVKQFAKRYRKLATTRVAASLVRVTLPVDELGKGQLFAITEPSIHCDAKTCMFEPSVAAFVVTEVDATKIADVRFTFGVDRMWRVRQWWAPRITAVTATLFDAAGKQLGEGAVLTKTPAE